MDEGFSNDPTVLQKTLTIEVQKGLNLEQRNVNADRESLAAIARAGGGAGWTPLTPTCWSIPSPT